MAKRPILQDISTFRGLTLKPILRSLQAIGKGGNEAIRGRPANLVEFRGLAPDLFHAPPGRYFFLLFFSFLPVAAFGLVADF
jgi:hypothetical protein